MAVTVFDVGESSGTEIKQCIRGGNKAGVVQMQELRREVKNKVKGVSREQAIQGFLGFGKKFVF